MEWKSALKDLTLKNEEYNKLLMIFTIYYFYEALIIFHIYVITKFLFYILGYFYSFFNFICNFFFGYITSFSIPKSLLHIVRNRMKKES